MTYEDLKSVITESYANFGYDYTVRKLVGADNVHSNKEVCFVKCIYKVLLNQDGDEDTDMLTKVNIQDCITLFNKYSGNCVPIEYT